MTHFFRRTFAVGLLFACLFVGCALSPVSAASTFDSGSTGTDGSFSPTASVTLQVPDSGVFNYTTVNIPSGVTVTFKRNNANTPVTILASGDVNIVGSIDVSGASGGNNITTTGPNSLDGTDRTTGGAGGPGGFDGGGGGGITAPFNGVGGDGPGGGGGGQGSTDNSHRGSGGSAGYASAGADGVDEANSNNNDKGKGGSAYGNLTLSQLIGGSGGGGGGSYNTEAAGSGGGGGGAILIACSGTLSSSGSIYSYGGRGGTGVGNISGGGGGSGGAIRLIATTLTGSAAFNVLGGLGLYYNGNQSGYGGYGYVRLEAINFNSFAPSLAAGVGAISTGLPGTIAPANPLQLQIVSVAGINAPASPLGVFHAPPDITVKNTVANPVTVALAGKNIPVGTVVTVSLTPQTGTETTVQSSALAGTTAASTATASVSLPDGKCILYASATIDLTAQTGVARLKMGGEPVDKILVAAVYGGPSEVTYILHSGRKIVVASALLGTKPGRN